MKKSKACGGSAAKKRKLKPSLLVIAAVSCVFILLLINHFYYITINYITPVSLGDYSENSGWSFYSVSAGEKEYLTPEYQSGNAESAAVINADKPVYCEIVLEPLMKNAVLDLGRVSCPAAVFLDDKLIFSNSDVSLDSNGVNFGSSVRLSEDNTIVTLPDDYGGKTLRIVFMPSGGRLDLTEIKLSSVKAIFGQESGNVVNGLVMAVCSLLFAVITICIFVAEKLKGKNDKPMFVLAIYFSIRALMPVNLDYNAASENIILFLKEYRVIDFMSVLATAVMLVFFTLKAKKYVKPMVTVAIIYAAVVFAAYITASFFGTQAVAAVVGAANVPYYIQLLLVFIIGINEWKDGSFFFKYYTILSIICAVGLAGWCVYTASCGDLFGREAVMFMANLKRLYLQPFLSTSAVLVAIAEFFIEAIHSAAYVRAVEMQSQLTTEYISNLNDTVVAVRHTRHELRHHIETMSIMSEQKRYDALEKYIKELRSQQDNGKVLYYSQNKLVSAIISSKLRNADEKKVSTEVSVNIPERLNVNSVAFSSFLMNLLENAMEACVKVTESEGRWIKLKIALKNEKVTITCANSSPGKALRSNGKIVSDKDNPEQHGVGLSIMHKCCESVGGSMIVEETENVFTVRAVFPLEK